MSIEIKWGSSPWGDPPQVHPKPVLGVNEDGNEVTLDLDRLFAGRLLIQGPSGSGKSSLLRRLIHECAPHVQWLSIDPEGETHSELTRSAPFWHDKLATNMRAKGVSTIIDISDMVREHQLIYLTKFINGLLNAPRELWVNRSLVIIDEVEIFTPSDTSAFEDPSVGKRSRSALVDLMSRGRKRGLCGIVATHRLAQLSASVRSEARNLLIGGCSSDVDIHRAADLLGWSRGKAFAILPQLSAGQFVAFGQAFEPKQLCIIQVTPP